MDDWKAATKGLTPFPGRTRSTIAEVVDPATAIGTLLVTEINVVNSTRLASEDKIIL